MQSATETMTIDPETHNDTFCQVHLVRLNLTAYYYTECAVLHVTNQTVASLISQECSYNTHMQLSDTQIGARFGFL